MSGQVDYSALGAIMSTVTAFVGVVAAIIAIVIAAREGRRWRIALQADLVTKLYEKFTSTEMSTARRRAATKLLDKKDTQIEPIYDVLDFFVLLGDLEMQGALDDNTIYRFFEYWVTRYWLAAEQQISALRNRHNDPELYQTFADLRDRMYGLRKKRGIADITEAEVSDFLHQEAM